MSHFLNEDIYDYKHGYFTSFQGRNGVRLGKCDYNLRICTREYTNNLSLVPQFHTYICFCFNCIFDERNLC